MRLIESIAKEMYPTTALDTATWRKAAHSHPNDACVDIARPSTPVVGIRDSKAPHAGHLALSPTAFDAFLDLIRSWR